MRSRIAPALLLFGLAAPAAAAPWTWAGPDGGTISSLALQPGSSNVLYAGTWSGVYKSVDGGATWQRPLQPPTVTPTNDIAVDPSHPAILYAVMGIALFKSADGGDRWTEVGQSLQPVNDVEVAPGGAVYAAAGHGMFRSTDGGATWQGLNNGLPAIGRNMKVLEIDPSRPERMHAASDSAFYRTVDGGAHWTHSAAAATGASVHDIAVSPASSKIVYAATSLGVARSLDGGATWLPGQGLGFSRVVAAHPSLPGTVYAGTPGGVFRSADQGRTWTRLSDGLVDTDVLALEIDPAAPATLWAGTIEGRLGGVFRSTDGGAHWTFRGKGISLAYVPVVEFDPQTPGTLFAAMGTFGLARSRDRGLHWTVLPLPPYTAITDVEVDPVNPSLVYALRGGAGPLLRSTDGGDSWSPLETAPGALFDLAIDPNDPDVLYGGGYGFHKSVDGGATWTTFAPSPPIYVSQIERASNGVLYAVTWGQDPRIPLFRVYRSRDAGQTWEVLNTGQAVFRLAVSPSNPAVVYATTGNEILRTTDGGDTWQKVSGLQRAISLAVDPGDPATVYAAADQGVLASTDGGATWSRVGEGLEGEGTYLVKIDPHDPRRLYAGVLLGGLAALYRPESCDPAEALCLQNGRFRVEAAWADFQGNTGTGHPIPMTNETGALWFFDPGNVELVVKVLDGRDTNGRFWVFAASLTSVEFTLTVTDIETGRQRVYHNPPGHMASFGDTDAF